MAPSPQAERGRGHIHLARPRPPKPAWPQPRLPAHQHQHQWPQGRPASARIQPPRWDHRAGDNRLDVASCRFQHTRADHGDVALTWFWPPRCHIAVVPRGASMSRRSPEARQGCLLQPECHASHTTPASATLLEGARVLSRARPNRSRDRKLPAPARIARGIASSPLLRGSLAWPPEPAPPKRLADPGISSIIPSMLLVMVNT